MLRTTSVERGRPDFPAVVRASTVRWFRRLPTWPMLLLLLLDMFCVVMHVYHHGMGNWSVEKSWTYPAKFEYLKAAAVAALFFLLYRRTGQALFGSWGVVFTLVVIDDSTDLHGVIARWWVRNVDLALPFGLWDGSAGEWVLWALLGAIGSAFIIGGYRRSDASTRAASMVLMALMVLLAVFAVIIDAWHLTLYGESYYVVGIIEDSGESMVISLVLTFVLLLVAEHPRRANGTSAP